MRTDFEMIHGLSPNHAVQLARDRRHSARASNLSVLRLPLRTTGVIRNDCAPASTSWRCSTKPKPQDSCTQNTCSPSAVQRLTCSTSSGRVNLRGACGPRCPRWTTAMIHSRCTSKPSLSIGLDRSIKALGSGWRGGNGAETAGSLHGVGVGTTVRNVMLGLRMDVFIDVNGYGYTDLHSVTLGAVTFQPNMTSNPAIASRLQSNAFVGRVAELWSLGVCVPHSLLSLVCLSYRSRLR